MPEVNLIGNFYGFLGLLALGVLVIKLFALLDAAIRKEEAFRAADKQNKMFWLIILGIAAAWDLLFGGSVAGLITIAGLIAAVVYIVDVRPAVRAMGRGGSGGRRTGPYGPW